MDSNQLPLDFLVCFVLMPKSALIGMVSVNQQRQFNLPESPPDISNTMKTMESQTSFLFAIPEST